MTANFGLTVTTSLAFYAAWQLERRREREGGREGGRERTNRPKKTYSEGNKLQMPNEQTLKNAYDDKNTQHSGDDGDDDDDNKCRHLTMSLSKHRLHSTPPVMTISPIHTSKSPH